MKYHWIVIETLVDCLENGIDKEKVKSARFLLSTELDKRSVDNLPIDEIKRLKSVLDGLYDKIYDNE